MELSVHILSKVNPAAPSNGKLPLIYKFLTIFCSIILFILTISSCGNSTKSISIEQSEYTIKVGETLELKPTVDGSTNYEFIFTPSKDGFVNINNNIIQGISAGVVNILISSSDSSVKTTSVKITIEEKIKPTKINSEDFLKVVIGTTYKIEYSVEPFDASDEVTFVSNNKGVVTVDENGVLAGHKLGDAIITIKSVDNPSLYIKIDVEVVLPYPESIEAIDNLTIDYKETYTLTHVIHPLDAIQDVRYYSLDESICSVDSKGVVTALKPGVTKIVIVSKIKDEIKHEVTVTVESTLATTLETQNELNLNFGDIYQIEYDISPKEAYQGIKYTIVNQDAIEVSESGVLTAKQIGQFEVILSTIDGSNLQTKISVNVTCKENTVFSFSNDFLINDTISIFEEFDPLDGIRVFDTVDGELTNQLVVDSSVDNTEYGTYTVIYQLESKGLYLERQIEVVWDYDVTFIGHAGSLFGAMNSEEAILYAATVLKYPAIEIDLKQTKDGVFVLSHDETFAGYTLSDYTWEELKNIEVTVKRSQGLSNLGVNNTFTAKLCTLERYLEICKTYNIIAVIELKTSAGISNWTEQNTPDKSRMPVLIKQIEEAGMINQIIFLTSQYECLAWTRRNGYDFIPCQYLVSTCEDQTYLNRCIQYNLDISFNVRDGVKNSDEWIKKYKDAGIKIATYTFEQYASYDEVQKWIDKGVDFITTDWHDVSNLYLPLKK